MSQILEFYVYILNPLRKMRYKKFYTKIEISIINPILFDYKAILHCNNYKTSDYLNDIFPFKASKITRDNLIFTLHKDTPPGLEMSLKKDDKNKKFQFELTS